MRRSGSFGVRPDDSVAGTWHGHGALVVPVLTADGAPAVLKLPFPHPEAVSEAPALQLWAGRGAVRLLDRDPAGSALLLERLDPDKTLLDVPVEEAVQVWGRDSPASSASPSQRNRNGPAYPPLPNALSSSRMSCRPSGSPGPAV